MITDTIISALTNLFALFCSRSNIKTETSAEMLDAYLGRHFGIRNKSEYLILYKDLIELYSEMPDLNTEEIVDGICNQLKSELLHEEGTMVLLRFMEFCCNQAPDIFRPDSPIFQRSSQKLGIKKATFNLLADFVQGNETSKVKLTSFNGYAAPIKTLWLDEFNILVFSYSGNDYGSIVFDDVPIMKGMFQTWDTSGVLRNHRGNPIYYSTIMAQYLSRKEKDKIVLSGRDINFRFPNSDNGMHNFSFDISNGELIAIMGGSGTGKTTLVSILNGTLHPQNGSITINGHDINEPAAKSLIGFVPQDDLLVEELTVYDNLYYTAKLCFDGMTEQEIDRRVMKTLKDLGLLQVKDLKVGSPIKKFISGGQRKRLNIALELIREPAVLFLDEPTSGLSSSDTENVILLLKEQTLHGRLVITNIHQPSSDVYKLFDRLWLLDKGGYPVYDGNPIEAITYFKTAANYADAHTSTCPTCGNVNPEVLLNIIEEKALDSSGRLTDERKVTPQRWHQMYLSRMTENRVEGQTHSPLPKPQVTEIPATDQKKPSVLKQWWIFIRRNVMTKITNRQYLAITLFEAPLLAGICALLTHYASPGEPYCLMNNKNLVSYLFMAIIVATFIGMSGSAEEIIKDRALLKREKFLNLSYNSYLWSKIISCALVSILQMLLFILVGNTIMGIRDQFLVWWGILSATAILANLTGLFLSQRLNSVVSIYISIPILLIPQILLCGLVVSFSDLTPNSTTGNVPAIGNLIPSRWAYEALAVTSFTQNDYERDFFQYDKQAYETQYYRLGFIPQLQSAVETMHHEYTHGAPLTPPSTPSSSSTSSSSMSRPCRDSSHHLKLLKTELPFLARICHTTPYEGNYDYASLHAYLNRCEKLMMTQGNAATLKTDQLRNNQVMQIGLQGLQELKRNHFNSQLASQLAGYDAKTICKVVHGHIVPNAGFVFLTPRTTNGNAPFYSSTKRLGAYNIPTLWFNMGVMVIMGFIVIIFLHNKKNT